jgi:hypothetical protein
MTSGTNHDFNRTNLAIESVICEVIDNSKDACDRAGTKKIDIVFYPGEAVVNIEPEFSSDPNPLPKNYSKSFSIAIFDDGGGFVSEQKLHDSFQIIEDPKKAKKRGSGDTGKFHLGMKEATLNHFHHFSLLSSIKGKVKHRSIRYPGELSTCMYDWETGKVNQNPSDKLPSHLNEKAISAYMTSHKMKTCGFMSATRKAMTNHPSDELSKLDDFISHMSHFIGIAYHKDLAAGKYEMRIGKPASMKRVDPVDLFWSEARPKGILAYQKANAKKLTKNQNYICKEMNGYGSLAGLGQKAVVHVNGVACEFTVTPYIVPAHEARTEFNKVTERWGKSKVVDVTIPNVSSSGTMFTAQNLQGFTFVRNGRTVIIGNMRNADNYGFYNGIPHLPDNVVKARVRIKIEYSDDTGEGLDRVFPILPNKDGYAPIRKDAWDAIDTVLLTHIDGSAAGHFDPHNKNAPFFKFKDTKRHWNSDIGLPDKGKLCKTCKKVIHKKGKTCPKTPCPVCGKKMDHYPCTSTKCGHICTICSKKGHLKTKCPTLKCKTCSSLPCICCASCKKHPCACPPPACTTCSKAPCVCQPPPATPFHVRLHPKHGDEYSIDEYYPSQRQHMIDLIHELMKQAKLSKKDL